MAVLSYAKLAQGAAKTWRSTGGTYAITATSLASGAARQGAKGDLGATWARQQHVLFTSAVGTAAANGSEIELWWGPSTSATAGTDNPSNLTGTDAALANPDEVKYQSIYIGSLFLSNAMGTAVQKQAMVFSPPTRYGSPFIVDKAGVTLSGTATDHTITITPIEEPTQDTV